MPKKIYFDTRDRINTLESPCKSKFDLSQLHFEKPPTKIQIEEISVPNILQITEDNNSFTFRTKNEEADAEDYSCNIAYLKTRTIMTVDIFITYLTQAITNSVDSLGSNPEATEIPTIEYVEASQTITLSNSNSIKFSFPNIVDDAPSVFAMIGLSERTMTTLSLTKVKQTEGTRTSIGVKTIYFNMLGLDIQAYNMSNNGTKVQSILPLYSKNNRLKYPQTESMIYNLKSHDFLKNLEVAIVDCEGKYINVGEFEFSLFCW